MVFVPISPELSVAFGTPLYLRTIPGAGALNQDLERAILTRREHGAGKRVSNIGGWQSLPDLLDWPEPAIKLLTAEIDRGVQQISEMPALLERRKQAQRVSYRAAGWANVNQSGNYNMPHMHPGCHWSVVYYVATGTPSLDTDMNGRIELRDPRPAAVYANIPGFTSGHTMMIRPHPGMMMVFPAWIEHWVHPFYGEGQRISVAINITVDAGQAA